MTKLDIIIIGAGIGGLTLGIALRRVGHKVTIYEQAKQLSEIGAGIQLAPNATRILRRLGLLAEVLRHANEPKGTVVRRYCDDAEIGPRSHGTNICERFGDPMLVIHRADLQRILLNAAIDAGVAILTGSQVVTRSPDFAAKVILENGQQVCADVLIGADGINSRTRDSMARAFGMVDSLVSTGDAAYRVTVSREKLLDVPEVLSELDRGVSTRWIGPHGHIMAYPIRGNQLYNMVMVHKTTSSSCDEHNMWHRRGNVDDLRSFYGSWSPTVERLISRMDTSNLMQWPLNERPNLPRWCINRTALLGDACHPMLPYVAQGAAQAIEDAATLATCLSLVDDIPAALTTYEYIRKSRAESIQGSAAAMRRVLHLADGLEQQGRDDAMRAPRVPGWKHPDLWADPAFQEAVWGYDVVAEAEMICKVAVKIHEEDIVAEKHKLAF